MRRPFTCSASMVTEPGAQGMVGGLVEPSRSAGGAGGTLTASSEYVKGVNQNGYPHQKHQQETGSQSR